MPTFGHKKGLRNSEQPRHPPAQKGCDCDSTVNFSKGQSSLSNSFKYPWQEKTFRTRYVSE